MKTLILVLISMTIYASSKIHEHATKKHPQVYHEGQVICEAWEPTVTNCATLHNNTWTASTEKEVSDAIKNGTVKTPEQAAAAR